MTNVRTGQKKGKLPRDAFRLRFWQRFSDPAFTIAQAAIEQLTELAWNGYINSRKAPRTQKAGEDYADPEYDLSVEWIAARSAIEEAQTQWRDSTRPSRILVICASPRNDGTCPGEISKTYRLAIHSQAALQEAGCMVDLLDLSLLTSEYGYVIYPCKSCVATAMPLCHWPCSCYPNHALGQVNDWMNEIYPRWVAAHGVMIITPVHWYQAPSTLKLMIDRLVCADGGNPDPTTTQGKDAAAAKELERSGWHYPRHLAGRAFSVIVHGDTEGVETLSYALSEWLSNMGLVRAGRHSVLGRYVGYYQRYCDSHEALDKNEAIWQETKNAALALAEQVSLVRKGIPEAGTDLDDPRPK